MRHEPDLFWPIQVVAIIALVVLAAWMFLQNYDECRTAHSAFYCVTGGP